MKKSAAITLILATASNTSHAPSDSKLGDLVHQRTATASAPAWPWR